MSVCSANDLWQLTSDQVTQFALFQDGLVIKRKVFKAFHGATADADT